MFETVHNTFQSWKSDVLDFIEKVQQPEPDPVLESLENEMEKHIQHVFSGISQESNTDPSLNATTIQEGFDEDAFEKYKTLKQKQNETYVKLQEQKLVTKKDTEYVTLLEGQQLAIESKIKNDGQSSEDEKNPFLQESFVASINLDNASRTELLVHLENVKKDIDQGKMKLQESLTKEAKLEAKNTAISNQIEKFEEENGFTAGSFFDMLFLECDPQINVDMNNPPKDPLTWIYIVVVVLLNLPAILMKKLAELSYNIVTGNNPSKIESQNDVEIIRRFFVEISYVLLSFWLAYIVLDYSLNPKKVKSTGPWTKFKWVDISFIRDVLVVLYYPAELFLRILLKYINPSFEYLRIEKYKPIIFVWVFFVSMYFVYNKLAKFRTWFFESFLTKDQFPTASGNVNFLLVIGYMSKYLGGSLVNIVSWALGPIGRLIQFIFVIIFVHAFAGAAQFMLSLWVFYYVLGPFFVLDGGLTRFDDIYKAFSGPGDRSCSNTGASFIQMLNIFIGTYVINQIKPNATVKLSGFVFLIWFLFFLFRASQTTSVQHPTLRILTGLINSIGAIYCFYYIISPFIFGEEDIVKKSDEDFEITLS